MNKVSLLVLMGILALSGCSDDAPSVAKIDGDSVLQTEITEYLKFKGNLNVSDKQKTDLTKAYVERKALALAISKQETLDQEQIAAELEEFKKQMLLSRYFDKFLAEKASDKAIENFYSINAEQYQSNKVKVAHILFRTRKDMAENEQQAKLTQAHELHSKLKAGENFEELAKQFSEDKNSAKKGGSIGWIKEGAIDAAFSQTAFSLAKDTYSEPIKTPFGFHIIKAAEASTVVTQPLEKVKGDIRYQLRSKAKEAELERLMGLVKVEFKEQK